jgi:hypothetical protein
MNSSSTFSLDLATLFNRFSKDELHQIGLACIQQSLCPVQKQQQLRNLRSSHHSPRPSLKNISSIPSHMNHQQYRPKVRHLMEQQCTTTTSPYTRSFSSPSSFQHPGFETSSIKKSAMFLYHI